LKLITSKIQLTRALNGTKTVGYVPLRFTILANCMCQGGSRMNFTPNYKGYTLEELYIAKHNVSKEKFPKKVADIELAIFNKENGIVEEIEAVNSVEINKYSTFWPRFWAVIIDGIIFALILYIECLVFGVECSTQDSFLQALNGFQLAIYIIFMHGYFGQTIGKMFTKIIVLNHDTETAINIKQALRRESVNLALSVSWGLIILAAYVSLKMSGAISTSLMYTVAVFSIVSMVWRLSEFVTMLFNDKRRGIHDYIGKTVVVRT